MTSGISTCQCEHVVSTFLTSLPPLLWPLTKFVQTAGLTLITIPSLNTMERFITLIGGEQYLPPKIIPPPTLALPQPDKMPDIDDDLAKLPSEDILLQRATKHNASLPHARGSIYPTIQPQLTPDTTTAQLQPVNTDLSIDPRRGEASPIGISFSPFGAVTRFCYKFVSREYQQPLATAFFDANKIYTRNWDL